MSTVVVVQARTGSTRLPGKVRLPLAGKTLLERMIERVEAATSSFDITVATTTSPVDDAIVSVCTAAGVRCFRGHPTDLLDRLYRAALEAKAETVIRIPSDCPLIDPAVIDRVLLAHRTSSADYTSNLRPPSYPEGNDVEVIRMEALARAHREATRPFEREHTTPYLWQSPQRFRLHNVIWETGLDYSATHRFTIDYPADYDFVRTVYDELWSPTRPIFSLRDILTLLDSRPDIFGLNQRYVRVNGHKSVWDELCAVTASLATG